MKASRRRLDDARPASRDGRVFRAINKAGPRLGRRHVAEGALGCRPAAAADAGIEKLAPHDLRRTCARLCHLAGGELDQIQFLLGHVSIQTTERYLGCKQKLRGAVNDTMGLDPNGSFRARHGWTCNDSAPSRSLMKKFVQR